MKRSFGIVVCVLAACACVVAVEQRWRDDLWLGRGGYWRARVGVTVENTSDEAWEGRSVSVPLAKLPLAGTRVEEIRLVDARGVQLEFGVWSGHSEFVTEGPVPADGMFRRLLHLLRQSGGVGTRRLLEGTSRQIAERKFRGDREGLPRGLAVVYTGCAASPFG